MYGNNVKRDDENGQLDCRIYSPPATAGLLCIVGAAITVAIARYCRIARKFLYILVQKRSKSLDWIKNGSGLPSLILSYKLVSRPLVVRAHIWLLIETLFTSLTRNNNTANKHYSILLILERKTGNACHAWCTFYDARLNTPEENKTLWHTHVNVTLSLCSLVIKYIYKYTRIKYIYIY